MLLHNVYSQSCCHEDWIGAVLLQGKMALEKRCLKLCMGRFNRVKHLRLPYLVEVAGSYVDEIAWQ